MLADIVVDTNVLMHAGNPDLAGNYFEPAVEFLAALRAATTLLCIDKFAGGSSLIAAEYLHTLPVQSFGRELVVALLVSQRVTEVSDKVDNATRQFVKKQVPRNSRDQRFVRVTHNTNDKVLVSHDFADMPPKVRQAIRNRLDIDIVTAAEALPAVK